MEESAEAGKHDVEPHAGVDKDNARLQEASALYGNLATAEEYGYVTRGYVWFWPSAVLGDVMRCDANG